ncbi:nicotinate-nucleotide adenylyltransferase [Seonamhaeicola maritimus]|uniref:Nicotinate-nucleotide adenylyltransferase n=1 Tax=Seonamhaeicola maritimus TaxID=2591822 RepID=A0A5C7GMU3_9FLAO|nr:nicotinate-nucleotide adenylyltransferase [Seonamhaeicola maritimus]TXG39625.1 nicotinate-nucleotide adenylyltransferase [Seonamhaeicola maritimus]
MRKIILSIISFIIVLQVYAQTIELPNTVISVNYQYLNAKDSDDAPLRVKVLEEAVLNYNNSDISQLYDDEYETYRVSFYIPEGKIVAAIDKSGKIIRTIEKYNNVRLPLEVMQAISARFPNWAIVEDVYLIKYHCDDDALKKEYKVKIKNEDKVISVRTNEKGEFI